MWEKLKNWWNRDKIRERELHEKIESIQRGWDEMAKRAFEAEEQVRVFRQREEADRLKREGKDPWVEIKSAQLHDVKGIQIELDWNDAFIQYLKDSGITGRDEETAVQKWLAFLYQDLITRLEQKVVDNSDKHRINDFQ